MSRDRSDRYYRAGQSALEKRDYDRAVDEFNRVIEDKAPRADGALYWRAYAENKLGKRNEALATLAQLRKDYPNSHWLDDARALEVEVRQYVGRPVSPDNASDEDMKLLILNNLVNSDPERIVPILQKLLAGANSPKVKERALFVLAQSHSQKARDLLAQIARGPFNPDLQMKAVEYLGVFGGRENAQLLADVYKASNDPAVKRAILQSFMVSGSRDALLSVAKAESNPDLRVNAIHQLGVMGGASDLMQLYTANSSPEVKSAILEALFVGGASDKLLEFARTDKDPQMRASAVRKLGQMGRSRTGDGLVGLYAKETDGSVKRDILNALFIQGNATALIEVARKETDTNLKREAVQKLSIMHTKEATDFLMELLNK
jgi:HEAT repeat protein